MAIKNNQEGVTLVELIAAVIILSVTVLIFVGSFSNISKAIISSKAKTLATNLAQEKIQILRQLPYHKILVTPEPKYYTEVSPPVVYDDVYFPPERILEGGIYFTRYTYVSSLQEIDGEFHTLPPKTPDQGMKRIEVSVVYDTPFGKKVVRLKTNEVNPEIGPYRGVITGKVRNAQNFQPLKDVIVIVAENIGCRDYTDANGDYLIRVPFGNYNVVASLRGYFSKTIQVSVGANPQVVNFDLQPMAVGSIYGYAWINDRIVISQVCGSTRAPSGFVQEWIELYNPTTFWWRMVVGTSPVVGIKYQSTWDNSPKLIHLVYYTLEIPPYSYYLIANTTTITACGVTKSADAVYSVDLNPDYPNIIKTREEDGVQYSGGAVGIFFVSSEEWIDRLGWDWNEAAKSAPFYETDGYNQFWGLEVDEQFVRKTSTFGFVTSWGNSYDSDDNNLDFVVFKPIQVPPRNSGDSLLPLTGRPAVGSNVSCNDGLSDLTQAILVGRPPVAMFNLVNVATGSWSVMISSGDRYIEIGNVFVGVNESVGIPNSTTVPSWYTTNFYVQISSSTELGFISGRVKNLAGLPLAGIRVQTAENFTFTNSAGSYFLASSTGIYSVVANPNNLNPLYVSATKENIEVKAGQITSGVDFILSQGGKVTGFVTRDGVNPLAGVVMVAQTVEGFVYGEDVSNNNGRFYISNLSSGTYYIKPVLSEKEKSIPILSTVTVVAGMTVHAGTFTITGSMGKISGKVISAGKPISTGVLIIASTSTFTTPPPLSIATLTSAAYFITSSYEDGSYVLEVIGSSTTRYNVYAYYTTYNLDGLPIINRKEITNIMVLPGQEVTNQNFSW